MKIRELKDLAEKNEYEFKCDETTIYLDRVIHDMENTIEISRIYINRIWVNNSGYTNDADMNMLEGAMAYVKTPLEDRGDPKIYIVPLPGLVTTDGEQQYVTKRGSYWFASRRQMHLKQTWREGSLYEIPKEYRDYAVEVEDGTN